MAFPNSAIVNHNRRAWQRMADSGHRLAKPVSECELAAPLAAVDSVGWLGPSIAGWRVLCLAAGGGRHGPLYAAAGGIVTVVDFSAAMLERDRQAARQYGWNLRLIETSMDDLSALQNAEFDLVIHPVSSCYLPDLRPMYREIARVTKPGGIYVSQHKQPASLQSSLAPQRGHYVWLHRGDGQPLPPAGNDQLIREPETVEFAHPLGVLLGEMCCSGFVIEDVMEPQHADPVASEGSFGHRACFIPPYLRVKARRREETCAPQGAASGRLVLDE